MITLSLAVKRLLDGIAVQTKLYFFNFKTITYCLKYAKYMDERNSTPFCYAGLYESNNSTTNIEKHVFRYKGLVDAIFVLFSQEILKTAF